MPVDSKVVIRPRSALGPEVRRARHRAARRRSSPTAPRMPATQASVPVEIDEVYNMFDEPTRRASQGNLQGFGDALAGRGADLNQTIQVAPELFGHLGSVMANLSAPRTELPSFFKELGDAARIVAPVSKTNAHLFTTMANTFEAISRDPQALKVDDLQEPADAARRHPVAARAAPVPRAHRGAVARPRHRRRPSCAARCRRSTRRCASAPPCSGARSRSTTTCRARSARCEDLVKAPTTVGSLRGLTATVGTLQPQLRYLGPFVTVCNSWNIFWTFAAEHLSAPDDTGSSQRALLNMATQAPGTDGIGSSGANEFAHGKGALPGRADQYVHNNVYAPGHRREGQRRLRRRPDRLHPGLQPAARQERQGRPLPGRRHRALPDQRAPRADLRAVRQGRQGPRPEPRPRAGRRDVHRPARRPRRRHREAAAMRRKQRKGMPPFAAGLLTLAVLAVVTYFGFTKAIPFKHHYTVQAVFPSANGVRNGSPVRVAGVNVGKVTGVSHVEDGKQAALVTMRIDKKGLPMHKDATLKIRPRIFLEGNFFVDVSPGSPSAPQLHDGDRLPINQTSAPVQLDQVLSALQAPTRKDLQALLRELSSGLKGKGARGYNALDPLLEARLPRQRDRRRRGRRARSPATSGATSTGPASPPRRIDRNREQLKSLVTDFDTTAGAFAAREQELSAAVGELPRTLQRGDARAGRAEPLVPGRARPDPRGAPGRALVGPGDRRQHALRQAGARPRVQARAARPVARPAPAGARADRAQPALGAALLAALAGLELPERRDPALDQGQDRRQDVPRPRPGLRGGDQAAARPRRREPLGRRQRPVVPRDAHRRRSSPTRWGPTSSSSPASRCRASTRPRPRTTPARRCAPTCRARPSSRRTCAPCPTRRRRASTSPQPSAAAKARGAAEDRRLAAQGPQGRRLRR